MPLDEFQKGITNLLSANRDIDSPFAGGAVIHRHGFRLSRDQDIFSGSDVTDIAARDIATLEEADYEIFVQRRYDSFIECHVVKPGEGATVLQWTQALSREFYQPVPDDRFGYRLHFADLAANKALAGATRSAVRDFVDLWMLDRHVLPLWRILCAAPGKDPDFNPLSMIERMQFNWHMAKTRDAEEYLATIDRSPESMGLSLLDSLRDASGILKDLPEEHYGRLQVRPDGQPVLARESGQDGQWVKPAVGGGMPSFEGSDGEMIAGLIEEYGPEGRGHAEEADDRFTRGW